MSLSFGPDADGDGVINLDPAAGDVDVLVSTSDRDGNELTSGVEYSDNNGEFWFIGLLPGDYVLVETEIFNPDGDGTTEAGDEIMASTSLTRAVTVGSGEELVWRDGAAMLDPITTPAPKHEVLLDDDGSLWDENLMFGNYVKGSVHGFKFEDYNGDGVFDLSAGDQGMGAIPFILTKTDENGVTLLDENDDPVFQVADLSAADGQFWFLDLVPGYYRLEEDLASAGGGDLITPSNSPSRLFFVGSRHELAYKEGSAMLDPSTGTLKEEIVVGADLKYGNSVDGSIHGFKCEDMDADGLCETTAHVVIVVDASLSTRGDFDDGSIDDLPGDVNGDGLFHTILDAQLAAALSLNTALAGLVGPNTAITATLIEMSDATASVVAADVAVGAELAGWITSVGFGGFVTGFDTNLDAALDLAITDISGSDPNRTNVYVMSDGVINVGDTGAALADEAAALATWSDNVVALGIGHDALLTDLLVVDPGATAHFTSASAGTALVTNALGADFGLPEQPQAGVEFVLTGTTAMGPVGPISITTGADGEFWFEELYPGLYTVTETVPPGQLSSTGAVWTQFIGSGEEYAWGEGEAMLWPGLQTEIVDTGLIFGNYTPIDLHGRKFHDLNGDGDGAGDPGMGGVTIELVQNNVVIDSYLTGPDGNYSFLGLDPGTYTVREVQPHPDVVATTPSSVDFTVYSGDPDVFVNFGNTILGSLHGFKFEDYNGNGIYEPQVYDARGTANHRFECVS